LRIFFIFTLCISLLFFACQKNNINDQGTLMASVNGDILTLEDLLGSYGEETWRSMSRLEQKSIIDQWIDITLLDSYAKKNHVISQDIGLKFIAKNAEKKIFSNALISNALNNIDISNDDLWNYYRLRQSEFIEQVREYRVQRIFLKTEEEMNRVKALIDNKDISFVNAAIQYSDEGIGRNGGYMSSLVTKSSPDSLLWVELNKKDRYYEVLMPYRSGWLIARWYEFKTATSNSSFFDVREEIREILKAEKKQSVYEELLKEARISANITKQY